MVLSNFYIKNKKAKNKTIVLLFVSYQNDRLKLSTGLAISPKDWNSKKQRAKFTLANASQFNQELEKKEAKIMRLYSELKDRPSFSIDLLRERFLSIKPKQVRRIRAKKDFHWFVKKYIDEIKFTKSEGTYRRAISIYKMLCEFETWRGKRIEFNNIDLDFYFETQKYFLCEKEYSNNYFGHIIKVLKVFLNDATERGYNKNLTFRSKKFKRIKEETDSIYLNRKEIEKIYQLDLSKEDKSLEAARDLFIIGCFTGLRFSDMSKLHDNHFVDEKYIHIKTKKTNETVVIPLHSYVKAIRKKYQDENRNGLPRAFSNPAMNRFIKELGKLAGIDQPFTVIKTKGGQRYEVTKPKYEFIVTHTARRSFATNAFLAEIPSISIMKITGHKTERAFMSYIKISQEDNARKLVEHEFFNS